MWPGVAGQLPNILSLREPIKQARFAPMRTRRKAASSDRSDDNDDWMRARPATVL